MTWLDKSVKAFFLVLVLVTLCLTPRLNAQDQTKSAPAPKTEDPSPSSDGFHISITPYIWFSGLNGTTGVLGHDASVHADFSNIFSYLNLGAMGALEARYNRVIMPVDFMWMKLSSNRSLPIDDEADYIRAKMTETMLTPKIGYRVVDGKKLKVDALFGFRYWHMTTDLSLQPTQPDGSFSDSASWVDAVAGGRFTYALTPKAFVVVAGDAGGGSARSDYQVGGALGYKISRRWDLLAGYRYLSVNYRPNSAKAFIYDVNMPGLVVGATFNLK
jgi:hypothetical protein